MAKYRTHGDFDDPLAEDGDLGFLGIDQLNDPTQLKVGMYQWAENIRVEGGKIITRDGLVSFNYYDKNSQEQLYANKATLKILSYESPLHGLNELVGFTGTDLLGKISIPPYLDGVPRADLTLPHSFCVDWDTFPAYHSGPVLENRGATSVLKSDNNGHQL